MATPRPAMYGHVATPPPHLNQHKREQLSITESPIFREILTDCSSQSLKPQPSDPQPPLNARQLHRWSSFIMLSLLLCLSALGPLAGAVTLTATTPNIDISACPIKYFGAEPYSTFDVDLIPGSTMAVTITFEQLLSAGGDDIEFPTMTGSSSLDYDIVTDISDASLVTVLASLASAFPRLIAVSAVCAIKFSGTFDGPGELWIVSYNIDGNDQTAAYMSADLYSEESFIFNFHGGKSVSTTKTTLAGVHTDSLDLTRCRESSNSYRIGASVRNYYSTCISETCEGSGEILSQRSCTPDQVCMGNNVCGVEHSCSIVANSVVDVTGATAVIPDFCAYDIVSGGGLSVIAKLRERRYTDTPFVDSVIISTTSGGPDYVTLIQGGKATLTDATATTDLTLSSTPTTQIGLSLYDLGDGPLASFTDSDGIITKIFFEGTLLHVKVTVPDEETLYTEGVCIAATDITGEKDTSKSFNNCDAVTLDSQGEGITCSDKQTRCTAELDSVKVDSVEATPYITACADNLLCGYHDGDDLYCRFKQAYARTANLDSYDCSASVCLNHECASHEFCAVAVSGDAACFCRRNDATINGYRGGSTYGPDATCDDGTASVTLTGCLLVEEGVNLADLHLNDETCTAVSNTDNYVEFTFDTQNPCGATSTVAGDKIQLDNSIQNTIEGQITREDSVDIKFSCSFEKELESTSSFSFQIKDGSITVEYTSGDYTFPLTISLYSDADMTQQLSASTELEINQKVYVKLEATDLGDSGLVLVINKCFTTTNDDPAGDNVYDLIDNDCPSSTDGTVVITASGTTTYATYEFNTYDYIGVATSDLFLHAVVSLCVEADGDCVTVCSSP